MTRRDIELMARLLALLVRTGELKVSGVYVIAGNLEAALPNFNRDKFEKACGIVSSLAPVAPVTPVTPVAPVVPSSGEIA